MKKFQPQGPVHMTIGRRHRGGRALHDLRLPNPPRLLARRPPTPVSSHSLTGEHPNPSHPASASNFVSSPAACADPHPASRGGARRPPASTASSIAAADVTAAPPPPPGPTPPPEPVVMATVVAEQKVSPTAPPLDVPAPAPPPPKKRKVEEAGFHNSAYYKIRATVADLRVRFVQVYEATDFRNSDAAREILKEIKVVMELAKKMRHDLGATFEPAKPPEKPLAGVVKDGPVEPPPSAENNHAPQTEKMGETPSSEIAQGSCVTGGSPIGWNFLVWPGGEVVYYGRTKEVFRAGQAEN
uniref:Uncharacterized protein n=1 Tax=Oryza rufipogon TaxID=4529 RepID=A0A0E0NIW0_ORYRU